MLEVVLDINDNNSRFFSATKKDIREYKKIIKKDYGVELDDADAKEQIERLLSLFDFIYGDRLLVDEDADT